MRRVRVPPALLVAGAAATQHLLSRHRAASPSSLAACVPVVVTSCWLLGASFIEFRRGCTTVNPADLAKTQALVVTGPNRLTRNPMYVGMSGLLTAHAILRRSAVALVPTAGFALLIDRYQIPAEEDHLEDTFGNEFERYRAAVPRWLIRFPARPRDLRPNHDSERVG